MAKVQLTTDDMTGDTLPDGTPTTTVTIDDPRNEHPPFEIDLSDDSLKGLLKAIEKYRVKGTAVQPRSLRDAITGDPEAKRFAAEARQWALAQPASAGLKVSPVGKVSQAVLDAYSDHLSASEGHASEEAINAAIAAGETAGE